MIVRFDNNALKQRKNESSMAIEGDYLTSKGGISEADAIVSQARKTLGEPTESIEKAASEMIVEEEEQEPGPELNVEAVQAARVKKS
jgi:protein phosphatase PTC1